MRWLAILALTGFLVVPLGAWAGVFVTDDKADTQTTSVVNDDLYMAGNTVNILHTITEDLFAAGNTVNVQENVGNDMHVAGSIVRLDGVVGQDVVAAGNTVSLRGSIGDDVMVAGNSVLVATDKVDDVFAVGSMVEISADQVTGDVYIGASRATLNGVVAGNVRAGVDKLTIGSESVIEGDLLTWGPNEPIVKEGAQIAGNIQHTMAEPKKANVGGKGLIGGWLLSVVAWFIAALVLYMLVPGFVNEVVAECLSHSGRSLGFGFLWLLAFIPAIILLFVSVVGWPLGLLSIFVTGELFITSAALSGVIVGVWAMKHIFKKDSAITWQHILLGTVVLKVVQLVPVVGWLVGLVVMVLTIGATLQTGWKLMRDMKQKAQVPETTAPPV